MGDLYVRCSLIRLGSGPSKFAGKLVIDDTEKTFRIVNDGQPEKKFPANKFFPFIVPKCQTATMVNLDFRVYGTEGPTYDHRLSISVAEPSQLKPILSELRKVLEVKAVAKARQLVMRPLAPSSQSSSAVGVSSTASASSVPLVASSPFRCETPTGAARVVGTDPKLHPPDDFYVRCSLRRVGAGPSKFSGKLVVDDTEKTFKIVNNDQSEKKFHANKFLPFIVPKCQTATVVNLNFRIDGTDESTYDRSLCVSVTEPSQMKPILSELRKVLEAKVARRSRSSMRRPADTTASEVTADPTTAYSTPQKTKMEGQLAGGGDGTGAAAD